MDAEPASRSRAHASMQTAPQPQRGSMPRTGPGSGLHAGRQVQEDSAASGPARPRMRSRADSAYLSSTDGSAPENVSGRGESRRQMKAGAITLPFAPPPRQSDPYRSPPAVPPKYLPQPAKAHPIGHPSLPAAHGLGRLQKGVYPRRFILMMRYVHKNRPDGDRLDTEDFIRLVRKQVLTGNRRDTACLIQSIF